MEEQPGTQVAARQDGAKALVSGRDHTPIQTEECLLAAEIRQNTSNDQAMDTPTINNPRKRKISLVRSNFDSGHIIEINKRVKSDPTSDCAGTTMEFEPDAKAQQTCDQTAGRYNVERKKTLIEQYKKKIQNRLEQESKKSSDHIPEHYFLQHNCGKYIEYYSWKKRISVTVISEHTNMFCRRWLAPPNVPPIILNYFLSDSSRISSNGSVVMPQLYISSSCPSPISASVGSQYSNRYQASALLSPKVDSSLISVHHAPTSSNEGAHVSTTISLPVEKVSSRKSSISASLDEYDLGTGEHIVEQAKLEASVVQRVNQLRKLGLWSIKRLPKVQEPPRSKVHWDYLLEEMQWLAADFLQERKWKRNSAKKCSRMVLKYHQFKESEAERIKREEQVKLKRIASSIAKMVKHFWSEVEKVVEMKQELQLNSKRKKIHDMQLRFIVDKADQLTEKLTQEFVVPSVKNSRAPSIDSEVLSEDRTEELTAVSVTSASEKAISTVDDDDYKQGESDSDDEEDTIAKAEVEEANESVNYAEELNQLADEADIPIEELIAKYRYHEIHQLPPVEEIQNESTTEDEQPSYSDTEQSDDGQSEKDIDTYSAQGLECLIDNQIVDDMNDKSKDDITDLAAAAAAESIQPKGNTLSSVEVITKVPFLLKYSLREYQHIGLDWLVAMYEKNLNGILADEMGLGKTIQTIALIAHLACEKGIWGPHLIVVPTSVMLNWEMEFKKWCPGLKILTYYGSPKERRLKRIGWTKANTFHVCITSYKLVIQDHHSFRRKKWVYLILDEAQHIKNFKSQRWQMLLNFNSDRRLLLTGTPLQNNLMELWSLMHFLMPNVFQSHREFKDWFDNPVSSMVEGNQEKNEELIRRLHKVLRPFLLRRLKCDVEKQLPKKYEHIIRCPLSQRQRLLYDEFMSLGKTQETLASGNFLSVINILMQLRKVCNHPNLFDPRPTISPYIVDSIVYNISAQMTAVLDSHPLSTVDLDTFNLLFSFLIPPLDNYEQQRRQQLQYDSIHFQNVWQCDSSQVYVRLSNYKRFFRYIKGVEMKVYPPPNGSCDPLVTNSQKRFIYNNSALLTGTHSLTSQMNQSTQPLSPSQCSDMDLDQPQAEQVGVEYCEEPLEKVRGTSDSSYASKETIDSALQDNQERLHRLAVVNQRRCQATSIYSRDLLNAFNIHHNLCLQSTPSTAEKVNKLQSAVFSLENILSSHFDEHYHESLLASLILSPENVVSSIKQILDRFLCTVPSVLAPPVRLVVTHNPPYKATAQIEYVEKLQSYLPPSSFDVISVPQSQLCFQLPETRLIQYDCGKLQTLDKLLWQLKSGKHRALIFTQMSRMLDIFEQFLNYHGHTYLRLDGTTKIEQRQALMERFNADQRIFCFILSTRSGGVGVNLTGADTVIFYDSDWNPTMDAQAQDRCHRIGQTRDVHIYRLISEKTVEENILKKAQQKKLLGDLAIEEGNFTTAFFKQAAIKELFDTEQSENVESITSHQHNSEVQQPVLDSTPAVDQPVGGNLNTAFEQALCTAEDDNDAAAVKVAVDEVTAELKEFDENIPFEETAEEKSPEEEEMECLISQLSPIEQFALRYLESLKDFQELKQAEEEIEETKKQWQRSIEEWRHKQETDRQKLTTEYQESIMTCSREDSSMTKVFMSLDGIEPMQIWAPPTPPQEEYDLYIDYSLGFLYEAGTMSEADLPRVYLPQETKRLRLDLPPTQVRKHSQQPSLPSAQLNTRSTRRADELFGIPKSPFDRCNSSMHRLRRELLQMKMRIYPGSINLISSTHRTLGYLGPSVMPPSNLTPSSHLAKSTNNFNSTLFPSWLIHEEFCIINSLFYLQELPFNLGVICPAHIPNWDFVAEQVNTFNSFKWAAKFCKFHFEGVMLTKDDPRIIGLSEEDLLKTPLQTQMSKQSKSNKKMKNQSQSVLSLPPGGVFMPPSSGSNSNIAGLNSPSLNSSGLLMTKGATHQSGVTGNSASAATQPLIRIANIVQKMVNDNNVEYTCEMSRRFNTIKRIVIQKTQTNKSRFQKQPSILKDQINLLQSHYDINYEKPLSVEEIAANRAERISKGQQAVREAREQQQALTSLKIQHYNNTLMAARHSAGTHTMTSSSTLNSSVNQLPQVVAGQAGQMLINQPAATVSGSSGVQPQSQPQVQVQSSQILLNPTSGSSSSIITSHQQLAQVLAVNKATASKLQSLTQSSEQGGVVIGGPSGGTSLNAKILNSQVVSIQPGANMHHHVTLSQAQSLGLLSQSTSSIATMSQLAQTDCNVGITSSALQQHLLQQSQANTTQPNQNQFIQSSPQQITINSSVQLPQKILAAISSTSSALNAGPNITQGNTSTGQIVTQRRVQQYKQLLLRQQQQQQLRQVQQSQQQQQQQSQLQQQQQSQPQVVQQGPTNVTRQVPMQSVRLQGVTPSSGQRIQLTVASSQSGHLPLNPSLISGTVKQIVATSLAGGNTSQANSNASPRILTTTGSSPLHLISSTVAGLALPSKISTTNATIIARSVRPDNMSTVTVVQPSSMAISSSSSMAALPITSFQMSSNANQQIRQFQLFQKRPVQVSSVQSSSAQPMIMQKAIMQSGATSGHSIVVNNEHSQQATHPVASSSNSANIITPLLQSGGSVTINKSPNTFHLVPSSMVQQQSGPITINSKTVFSAAPVAMQQAIKQSIIVQQQQQQQQQSTVGTGQVANNQSANPVQSAGVPKSATIVTPVSAGYQLGPQSHLQQQQQQQPTQSLTKPNNAGQQLVSVNTVSTDGPQTSVAVSGATIRLLTTSGTSSLPASINTPKGHIIISGPGAASLVGQAASVTTTTTTTAISSTVSSNILHQMANSQTSSSSGQTFTFAIRTALGSQSGSSQPASMQLNTVSLKPTSSSVNLQQQLPSTSGNVCVSTTRSPSALVAALTQNNSSATVETMPSLEPIIDNNSFLRNMSSPSSSPKTIPIMLMQPSGTSSSLTMTSTSSSTSSPSPSSLSLININDNEVNNTPAGRANSSATAKITIATQTAGSILNADQDTNSENRSAIHAAASSPSSKPRESTLIEALMSPIGKSIRSQYQPNINNPSDKGS